VYTYPARQIRHATMRRAPRGHRGQSRAGRAAINHFWLRGREAARIASQFGAYPWPHLCART